MKPLIAFFALALLACAALRAAPPAERGQQLEPGRNDAGWRWLFSALAAKGPTFSTFTENRQFAARKEPVVLTGEMRLLPDRGLSLCYLTPEETLTVIDAQGIYLRNAKGRVQRLKAGTRDAGLTTALLPVMRFDEAELHKNFTLYAVRDGAEWRFDFVPLNEKLADALGSIVVTGIGTEIKRLAFNASSKLGIEVLVGETKTGIQFSDEELKKFFP